MRKTSEDRRHELLAMTDNVLIELEEARYEAQAAGDHAIRTGRHFNTHPHNHVNSLINTHTQG